MNEDGELLATFVHISDLHIGEIDPTNGNATTPKGAGQIVKNLSAFDGLLGHQAQSLQELAAFCSGLKRQRIPFDVVVTGDYTRCGAGRELSLASRFLRSQIGLPPLMRRVGLQLGTLPVGIPGNHDHWGGASFPLSGATSLVSTIRVTPPTPYVHPPKRLNSHRTLVMAGIDSDADVKPIGLKRLQAIGSFQSQLGPLGAMLGANPGNEVRVLLVHHSWNHAGRLLRMDKGSKDALARFVTHYGIRIVLTGHTHAATMVPIGSGTGSHDAHEFCCGSTTQLDYIPFHWKTFMGGMPKERPWNHNTLIVHRVFDAPAGIRWQSQIYRRSNHSGFQPQGATFSTAI